MKKRNMTLFSVLAGLIMALSFFTVSSGGAEEKKKAEEIIVSEGKSVKVNYTLTVDGKVLDSSKGREPLQFKAGNHEMIPGFEKAVMGMKSGEKKSFTLSPAEGYGQVDPKALQDIPKKQLPPDITPKAGMTLLAQGNNGQGIPVKIVEVKEDVVVIDFNHPLAGKTLNFDVEVLEVK
jgi:FKBP-type peptidyl-prolyl cis-trans isomerase 2